MQLDEQRLRFRDAMASLSAAVNIITTEGDAGQCGITATAVCSVTDTPPSLMVCINANSAMNPVFQGNGKLCVNVLNHEQELMARHFAGMTGMAMEERFSLSCWQKGPLAQPVLKGSLASLEGEIRVLNGAAVPLLKGFLQHIDTDDTQQHEGHPMVNILNGFGKEGAQKEADGGHQGLKTAEP